MKTIVITQPTFLPWLGYFKLMSEADVFVFLDNVKFEKRSWQCRNKIKTSNGVMWLTTPTLKRNYYIKDVEIDNNKPWKRKQLKAIQINYSKSPFFDDFYPFLKDIYCDDWNKIAELNVSLIKHISKKLNISPLFVNASDLNVKGKKSELLLNICKQLNANRYLSSIGAKNYMNGENAFFLFEKENIMLEYFEYKHPNYNQLYGSFVPYLSIIDCLFNNGQNTSNILLLENGSIED